MAGIQEYLDLIKNAVYGRDVRQAIHDGIHQCYEDGRAGAIDLVAREEIAELVAPSGEAPSAAEVTDARIGADGISYTSLGLANRTQFSNLNDSLFAAQLIDILKMWKYPIPAQPLNGVTFTYIDKAKYQISGTASASTVLDIFSSFTQMPLGMKAGEKYMLHVEGVKGVEFRIFFSTNGSSWNAQTYNIKQMPVGGEFVIEVPSNALGVLVRLYVSAGTNVNTLFSASLYSAITLENDVVREISDVIEEEIAGIYSNKINTVGDIYITTSGWVFNNNSTTRARTNADNYYHLYAGDLIKLKRPDLVRMYLGYRDTTGNYYTRGWIQEDFIIPFECDCVVLLSYVTETAISNAEELAQYVSIYKNDYVVAENAKNNNEITANVKSINHQGYNYLAPNQSLEAYKLSKKHGFNYVECDVLKTADGVYVINHDNDISRTGTFYDITGETPALVTEQTLISDLTYAQLVANYDIRKSLNDDYAGCKIARFDDFIMLCKRIGLHAYVELKTGGTADTQALHDIVKDAGMIKNVTWISSLINYLNQMKAYDDSVRLGYVVNYVNATTIAEAQSVKTDNNEVFMDASYTNLTSEAVALCKDAGMELEAWIVNTKNAVNGLDSYITAITSDLIKYSDVYKDF